MSQDVKKKLDCAKGSRQKKTRIFYGQFDRKGGQPPPGPTVAFVKILTLFFPMEYDSLILKTHFT